jgi:uncharacterized protein (DUF486 family)
VKSVYVRLDVIETMLFVVFSIVYIGDPAGVMQETSMLLNVDKLP